MSEPISVRDAWAAYDQAIRALYAPPAGSVGRAPRGEVALSTEGLVERSRIVLDCSQALGDALTSALDTDNLDRRELAGWKLLAAAAYDLSIAADLLQAEEAGAELALTRSTRSAVAAVPELKEVLEAPMNARLDDLVMPATRAALPTEPAAAKMQLEKAIATLLDEIPDAAASMSQTAVSGVITAGLGPAQQMASVAVQEILAHLPDAASAVVRYAGQILAEALRKLEAALGKNAQEQAQDEASSWLKEIQQKRDTVTSLLDKLYKTKDIGAEVRGVVEAVDATTAAVRYNQATQALHALLARYDKTKKVLEGLMRVLAFVKTPLLGAVPWGPIGVYGTYVSVLAYAVFSGGDYLDWYRLGDQPWLDRVDGLRTTVRTAVQGDRPPCCP